VRATEDGVVLDLSADTPLEVLAIVLGGHVDVWLGPLLHLPKRPGFAHRRSAL